MTRRTPPRKVTYFEPVPAASRAHASFNSRATRCVSAMAGRPGRRHLRPPFRNSAWRRIPPGLWVAENGDTIIGFGFSWMTETFWYLSQLSSGPKRRRRASGDRVRQWFLIGLREAGGTIWQCARIIRGPAASRQDHGGNRRGHQLQEPVVGGSRRGDGPVRLQWTGARLRLRGLSEAVDGRYGLGPCPTSFALSFGGIFSAMMVPVFGWLMDRWSIRKVALPGIAIYVAAIALLALSPRSLLVFTLLFALAEGTSAVQTPIGYAKAIPRGSTAAAG